MTPPSEQDEGFAQGPGTAEADAPQGPDVQVAGDGDGAGAPATTSKVTLDLDDAPFMKEEEPEEEPAPSAASDAKDGGGAAPEDAPPKKSKKKLIIIAGAAVGLLVVLAAVYFLFLRAPAEPPPPPPEPPKPEIVVVPSKPKVEVKPDVIKELEPFVVPHVDAQGRTHFLNCKFSMLSKDPLIAQEVDSKLLALRDAVYFYLRSKDTAYLMDATNAESIKKELRGVVSDYLTRSKLDDVLLDSYLNE